MSTNQQLYRNTDGGYWVATADPAAATHARTGIAHNVHRTALLSDGAARSVDIFQLYSWKNVLDLLDAGGPDTLITAVRQAETEDPCGVHWPRFKKHDDAACAYTHLPPPRS